MGRKRTQPEEKYLKRRRYYLKSKGYSDEEIEAMLEQTTEDPLFNDVLNDIDLVNQFNKTLIDLSNKEPEQVSEDNEIINEKNTNMEDTNTNTNTFTNEFVNEDTNTNTNTNLDINTNANANTNDNVFVNDNVSDNVKFEFDDTLKNEDTNFTQQEQPTEQKKDIAENSSVSGKMFMLTVNILLTSASKFIKKDITLDEQEINEFAKLYDEAYPEGLPVNPKIVFWGGLAMTITTKALKK